MLGLAGSRCTGRTPPQREFGKTFLKDWNEEGHEQQIPELYQAEDSHLCKTAVLR